MADLRAFVATIRCRSWHGWPEKSASASPARAVALAAGQPARVEAAVLSYVPRTAPAEFDFAPTNIGPLVWRGTVPGRYVVRGSVLKAPEDTIAIELQHEHPRRGEVDVCVSLVSHGDLTAEGRALLESRAWALLALLNLRLRDYLTPVAPLQIAEQQGGSRSFTNELSIAVRKRDELVEAQVHEVLDQFADMLGQSGPTEKLLTALELYGAHFSEASAKVRFLLLVMALEALASPAEKHDAALELMNKWQDELRRAMNAHAPESAPRMALEALERELKFRRKDSIRNQIRRLFERLPNHDVEAWPRRALKVYDKRSTLVHEGTLPTEETAELEREALSLVEAVLRFEAL